MIAVLPPAVKRLRLDIFMANTSMDTAMD